MDNQLRSRHRLVETVKSYAGQEKSTLDAVISARNAAVSTQAPERESAAEGQFNGALQQLFALTAAYLYLKANTELLQMQGDLSNLKTNFASARRFFNNALAKFKTAIGLADIQGIDQMNGFNRTQQRGIQLAA